MKLQDVRKPGGLYRAKKRVGRGGASGHGKTSTRGHKGAKSRSGPGLRAGFEGGQMPLIRRIPKRGFISVAKKSYQIVNVESLGHFKKDSTVDKVTLKNAGLIKSLDAPVKILGDGKLAKSLTVSAEAFSGSAKKKILEAGGKTQMTADNKHISADKDNKK